ncbi:MAG TPA: chlorite dismutase family protein [Kiritimatiellia bacterium]|nr:chlorite dismutase family protein [Kiritimatiellia bacterium]HMO97538.1 chlorite dismutase family protein [Kiritimatiellia bacterium]HMP97024.1 chlorite dismutase family protein [Kiritimatiellia bacterium]
MSLPVDEKTGLPDLSEKGRDARGEVIRSERRLFMQLQAYGLCADLDAVIEAVQTLRAPIAVYADINDPMGVAIMGASEDPEFFVGPWRHLFHLPVFADLVPKPEYTMMGRSYSIGYEADLDHVLVNRPIQRLTNPLLPWAVWYPLRRAGAFEKLPAEEQRAILGEHGQLGSLFSAADLGYDIRLDCRGIDKNDNDFVIGLIGKDLFPLSAMVQAMRKTRQTSEFLERLGPFFVGKAVWQQVAG